MHGTQPLCPALTCHHGAARNPRIDMASLPDNMRPNDSADDLAALQGIWEQVGFEENGVTDPPDDHGAPGALTSIHGNRFEVRTVAGELLLEGGFTFDASTTPRSITWVDSIGADAGKQLPAIYRLEGDHFVFVAADEGMPRPAAFRTSMGLTMRSFVRKR
ncbi:TIGR03067 domain-containing protein [Rhodanobacter sp. Si-c]|uniref:TIGR03067 domain-containing protein n=1 Tax=Rhodanobacter lycopersici TaxID=3162487 RepID=A0ABV3QAK3_9GAMM